MALTEKLKAIADAIRGKTGKTDGLTLDQMPTEIEGIQSGGGGGTGAEVYYSDMGQMYTPHMVIPNIANMRYVRDHFSNADKLVTFKQQYGSCSLDSDYGIFSMCTALEEVWVSRATFGQYCFRGCGSLRKVTLGRIGLAVTTFRSSFDTFCTKIEEITCYVDANTISEIPTSVTSGILPQYSPNATIIYRNSTTGEVITE